jgi:hypothetical protein
MNKIIISFFICLIFMSCSSKKNIRKENTNGQKVNQTKISSYLFDDTVKPFYTVDPKLQDIESEIALLKEQVIQYESQLSTPNFNTEILKLIRNPSIKHEIQLSNGTTIQGTIIYENIDELIVETQIGQLKISKSQIVKTEDIMPPVAKIEFIGDAVEEIYENSRAYSGTLKNIGLKRADFVRVIYSMYDQNSDLIISDSSFISGIKKQFNSGIISDASINLNEFSNYYVDVDIPSDKIVKYFLREVRWEYFE